MEGTTQDGCQFKYRHYCESLSYHHQLFCYAALEGRVVALKIVSTTGGLYGHVGKKLALTTTFPPATHLSAHSHSHAKDAFCM